MGTATEGQLVMDVTRSELTPVEGAEWLEANPPVGGDVVLRDPDGAVIGLMTRGPGWRLVATADGALTLLWGELPR